MNEKIANFIKKNISFTILREYYSYNDLINTLNILEEDKKIVLLRKEKYNYKIINYDLEENILFRQLLKGPVPLSTITNDTLELFKENCIGDLIIKNNLVYGINLKKLNILEKKLKGKIKLSDELFLLEKRSKIEINKEMEIIDYNLIIENNNLKEKVFKTEICLLLEFENFKTLISTFLIKKGFEIRVSKEIISSYMNFDFLNQDEFHPARRSTDTFYLDTESILRTQLTGGLFETLINTKMKTGRFFEIGRVYRNEKEDKTHLLEFHQLDIHINDSNLDITHLISFGKELLKFLNIPEEDIFIKPTYYPFTSPSIDFNVKINNKDLEVGGGGMFRKNILKNTNLIFDTSIGAGFGLERLFTLYYKYTGNISDIYKIREINDLYASNKI